MTISLEKYVYEDKRTTFFTNFLMINAILFDRHIL